MSIDNVSFDLGLSAFGAQSGDNPVKITNTGNADLVLGAFTWAPKDPAVLASDFSTVGVCKQGVVVTPGASCDFALRVKPSGSNIGLQTADLNIASNAGTQSVTVAYNSKAGPAIQITNFPTSNTALASVPFGNITFASPTPGQPNANVLTSPPIYVKNTGSAPLNVDRVYILGSGDFIVQSSTCVGTPVAIGGSCKIDVLPFPGSTGPKSGTLVVSSDAFNSLPPAPTTETKGKRTLALSATVAGTPPIVPVTANANLAITAIDSAGTVQAPNELDFSKTSGTTVGLFSARFFIKLANNGTTPIPLFSTRVSGANSDWFFVGGVPAAPITDPLCGATLAAGASCVFGVDFKPLAVGPASVQIQVWTDINTLVSQTPAKGSGK